MAKFKMAEFKIAAIINLSWIQWVWVRMNYVWVISQSWVRMFLSSERRSRVLCKMAVLNPRWQYSRWLPSSSWVRMNEWSFFLFKMVETKMAEFIDGWHHQVEWMNEFFFFWEMAEWIRWLSQSFVQNGWIQDGRIQDGCHHHINQIELVWIRVRVEWECFWVNLREDNKVSDSKMAVSESKMAEFQDGCHHQVESEWMSEVFYVQMVETNLGKCEWVWEEILRWLNPKWQNSWWQNSRWLPSPS